VKDKIFFGSLARISDLESREFDWHPIPREQWEAGDYVVGSVAIPRGGLSNIELTSGRLIEAIEGDLVLGALGIRHATMEVVGSYQAVGPDGRMELLTAGGILGRATSVSGMFPPLMQIDYRGHAARSGQTLHMRDFAKRPHGQRDYAVPTILIVGTSMSAGKTTSAKIIIRQLKRAGFRVVGTKLTGAGRYRDILAMSDAGADAIFDFVDVGLPSSVLDSEQYRKHLRELLGLIREARPDVVVAEAGASPLERYNGKVALDELGEAVTFTVLCASDPYAVVGVMRGFDIIPDLVAGLATSTSAGVELVEKLSGVRALNLLDPSSMPKLHAMLDKTTKRAASAAEGDGRT
jgi:hypothetical protein